MDLIGNPTKVLTMSGNGSELAAIKAIKIVRDLKPKLIIITTGICDLTWRDKNTKKTKLRYSTVEECVTGVLEALKAAHDILESLGNCKISIATITGLDLADYNLRDRKNMNEEEYKNYCKNDKTITKEQDTLNSAIVEINRMITVMNKKAGVPTTWLSTVVHTYYRKTHHHNYNKLSDGCHPNDMTKLKWAKLIAKSIQHILND